MKLFPYPLIILFWATTLGFAPAQTPAQPADPNQMMPAAPVHAASPAQPASAMPTTNTPANPAAQVPSVAIIADGSLKAVLQELAQTWADSVDSSPQMPITLTNAGTMRAKIESGGSWDLVISADIGDVKEMTDKGFLLAADQRSLARNTVVLLGRQPLVKGDELDWFDLVGTEWKKVALGNPDLVASGRVAMRALQKHGLMNDDHKDVYVYGLNETAALQLAQRQQADAVFVYKTDLPAASLPGFDLFPLKTEDAPPVFYAAALFRQAKNPALARAFLDYCGGEAGRAIWLRHGFETN